MATVVQAPALRVTQDQAARFAWRITSAYPEPHSAVDLSTWEGRFSVAAISGGPTLAETTPYMDADGYVTVSLTPAQVESLIGAAQIGGRASAFYQLNLDAPESAYSLVLQGGISIARAVA